MTTTSRTSSGARPGVGAGGGDAPAHARQPRLDLVAAASRRRSAAGPGGEPAGPVAVAAVGVEVGGLAGAAAHVVDGDVELLELRARRRRRGRATACPTRSRRRRRGRRRPRRRASPRAPRSSGRTRADRPSPRSGRRRARAFGPRSPGRRPRPGRDARSGPRRPRPPRARPAARARSRRRGPAASTPGAVATMPSACGRCGHSGAATHDVGAVHLVEVAEHVARCEVGQQPPVVLGLRGLVVAARRPRG